MFGRKMSYSLFFKSGAYSRVDTRGMWARKARG